MVLPLEGFYCETYLQEVVSFTDGSLTAIETNGNEEARKQHFS